jgi:hypothetical protein
VFIRRVCVVAIDRVGQKVVCVVEFDIFLLDGSRYGPVPVKDQVYTVAAFGEFPFSFDQARKGMPGISLVEVPDIQAPRSGSEAPWPMIAFRPVDERKTDISEIVRNALDVKAPTRVDELAELTGFY